MTGNFIGSALQLIVDPYLLIISIQLLSHRYLYRLRRLETWPCNHSRDVHP